MSATRFALLSLLLLALVACGGSGGGSGGGSPSQPSPDPKPQPGRAWSDDDAVALARMPASGEPLAMSFALVSQLVGLKRTTAADAQVLDQNCSFECSNNNCRFSLRRNL